MAKQNSTKQTKESKETRSTKPPEQNESASDAASALVTTPFALMKRFGEEMDRLFGDFNLGRDWLTPGAATRGFGAGMWSPQVEMFEREGQLVVHADLPGLTKDDVNVEIHDDAITIEGERRGGKEEKSEGFYRSERSYGKFYRRLPLPDGVNVKDANATFDNGVLEITLEAPKRTETKRRRVEIRDAKPAQAKGKAA
jgi:HSP20 family protein